MAHLDDADDADDPRPPTPRRALGALANSARALELVWRTSRGLTVLLVVATLVAGLAPAGAAYVARFVVDAVVAAAAGDAAARTDALWAILAEAVLMASVVAANRGLTFCRQLLEAKLAHTVTHLILEKAVRLRLSDFEDPALHDRLEEARREATVRPLSLVLRSFTLARYTISLIGYFALLVQLSWWAVAILVLAGVPSFLAEARFSQKTFRFFRRHSPENRERHYVETLLTREEFAKEIGFFGLGPLLIERYDRLFERYYGVDRRIAIQRHAWGLVLGLLGTVAFFGAYVWIVLQTVAGALTLGQMTMYLVVFRQGQSAVSSALAALGGIYEDALYLETLDAFLGHPVPGTDGVATEGPNPGDGLRVEDLSWTYPGSDRPALSGVSFHLRPGRNLAVVGHNGSGKSTLVKLLTRRYVAEEGRILLDGLDIRKWSAEGLRARISVLFQDYNRYKLTAGENVGAGDPPRLYDEAGWEEAARRAMADDLVAELPDGFHTRLGRAFRGAQELSGGQWQRLAFARSLMKRQTDLLVFDEPTSAADPKRQAELDERLAEILDGRMGLIVSHRLATARIADRILVLDHGRVVEQGSHDELVEARGVYAELFETQAEAYQ
jgi:ABC-type multidrug transport system fused ATPase/permease subunit